MTEKEIIEKIIELLNGKSASEAKSLLHNAIDAVLEIAKV